MRSPVIKLHFLSVMEMVTLQHCQAQTKVDSWNTINITSQTRPKSQLFADFNKNDQHLSNGLVPKEYLTYSKAYPAQNQSIDSK